MKGVGNHLRLGPDCRDRQPIENRLTHINSDSGRFPVFDIQFEVQNSRTGLNFQMVFRGNSVVVNVFRDASDSIAAHFRFRSVGVEHAHLRVCLVGRTD